MDFFFFNEKETHGPGDLIALLLSSSHSDPDSVAFCVLATDEEYQCDIALQIHFTLIQAFCFDNDINVVRVNDIERLADLVGADESGEPKDVHCILVTVSFPRRTAAAGESCMHHHHPPPPPRLDSRV